MTEQVAGAAVRREVTVQAPVERAFEVFTEGMATWWPHDESHNVGPTPADGGDRALRTSTSLAFAGSGSYCHCGFRSHAKTTRFGGSHAITRPQSVSVPSCAFA